MKRTSYPRTYEIDVRAELWTLLKSFATRCSIDCCNLGAFDFEVHRAVSWVESWGKDTTKRGMQSLKQFIEAIDGHESTQNLRVPRLNYTGTKDSLLASLRQWESSIHTAYHTANFE